MPDTGVIALRDEGSGGLDNQFYSKQQQYHSFSNQTSLDGPQNEGPQHAKDIKVTCLEYEMSWINDRQTEGFSCH